LKCAWIKSFSVFNQLMNHNSIRIPFYPDLSANCLAYHCLCNTFGSNGFIHWWYDK